MTTFANFIKQPTHPRPAVSDPLILGSPSGWFGPETMIGASAVQILRRSIAAALLGLSLLLGLAAPDEAHAQTSCNVSDATTQATNAYNYHRNNAAGNAPTATAAYRVLVALGGTLPAWSGTNISSISAPTTPISEAELRTFLTGRSDTWAGWNPVYTALSCLEAALPTVTISGGPAVTEGAGAQFTVNISPAQGSSVTVNLTVSDVAGSDYVASSNQGSQTVSIPANQTSATHTVPTVNDQSDEANGDVTVTVIGGGVGDGYRIGATATATVRVNDNDEPAGERHLLISNIGQAGNNNSSGSLNVDRAQAFTTGSHKPGYTVNSVDIVFESNSLSDLFRTPNPSLTVTIRNASNGIPGTTVGTLNLPASSPTFGSRRSITFAAPTKGIQLSPSTTYFLMIDIDAERSTTGETDIWLVDSNTEDAGGAAGFSIANESQMYAWSANAWESTNNSFQMRIKGESNPITDLVQMRNATRNIAEFGNHKGNGGIRVLVEIGDGMSRQSYARTINYTVDGKADRGDGKDYTIDGCTSSNCSVRLPANRHSVPITIYVNDDGLDENEETITLTLQDGSGYTVNENRKTTTVTIRDDDTRGLMFHRRWPDVDEGGSETYTVKLASQPTAAVTVKIDSNNQDVTASPTSLTFNPSGSNVWSRTQTVTVSAAQDSDAVDDEATLTHTTSGGDYGGAGAMSIERPVSVDDDDTADPIKPQLPLINLTGGPAVTEGAAASFTVHADPSPTARLTVSVEVIEPPGQDFVAASQERVLFVSLNAGATTATFSVPTVNDSTDEDDGAVQVFVNDGAGYVAGQGTAVTVFDNDEPIPGAFFRSTSSDAVEHDGTHRVQVYLNYPAPAAGLRLRYRLTGTATAGSGKDFTIQNSGTVSIAARGASATIPVAINDDSAIENAETVILTLIGGTGYTVDSPSVHTLTIADNDSPTASFASSSSRAAENAGTHNVTVNISPAPVGGLTLGYSVTGTATAGSGNDFTIQNSGSLTIAAGATSATIPVAINDDSTDDRSETVILTLTDGTGYTLGSTTTHTLTITDNDGITSVLLTPLIPSNTIPEGASVAITGVFSENNRHLSPKDIVTLPLTIGGTATLGTDYRLTCGPVKIPVVVTCNGLNGNNPSITFDASRLRNPFVRVPGSLHLEALEDNTSESNETVTLSIGGGPTRTMTITEAPSSVAVSFTRATYSINEGASPLPPVITVTPASGRDLTIPLIFTDVSATGGADYTAVSQVVLEADGNTRYSFDVPIADDTAIEGDETFKMAIDTANLPAGVTAGTATEATVTIVDNDPVPVAHWKFDGDADDSAGSSNGSAMNGASFTTTATIGSHALVLDGSDDHVNLTPHVTKFPLGNSARSISGWFKADAGNQRQTFLTYGPNIEGKRLSIAADRTQALVAVSGHAWGVNNLSLAEGWHHIAVTFAGGQSDDFSIYLDGALQSASTLGGVARQVDTRTGTAAIGRNVGGTAHYGGEIDDVRLYDFALSLKQVQAMAAWREDVQPAAAAFPMRAPMGLVVRGWSASDMSWGMSGTTAVDVEAPEAGVRRQVPLLPSASNPQHAGLVRIVNPTARAGRVRILAVDDTGRRSDPVVLGMGARETLEFTSRDLEWGGAAFDPEESTGPGMGHWRLEIESDLEVEVSGYVRAADGTLSEMGGVAAPSADNVHRLALFHPADSSDAASLLRLTNRGGQALVANITGIDDTGASPGGVVSVEIGAHGSVMLTAAELESGGADLLGALGDGGGAWRLDVVSDGDLAVMNLVETPDGHLANLSNAEATPVPAGVVHGVAGFPSGAVESGEVGVLRIVNGSGVSGSIRIRLHDGVGWRYAPLTLSLGAGEAVNLSALDLELGNTSKGLIGSAGPGSGGEWRLGVSGDIDIKVMALVRLPSGLLEALP